MSFKKILFPVDFSERSHAIAPHVRAVCNRFGASLTLVHFFHVPALAYIAPEAPLVFDFPADELRASAEQNLARFAEESFPDMAVDKIVEEGDPGTDIAALARTLQVDLIMLPTRGQGRFRAALLGSVTAKTLHDAECPVWTEAHCEEAGPRHANWHTIVCAIDTTPEGVWLIRAAAELAASIDARVSLVHATTYADSGTGNSFELEFTEFAADRAREAVAAMQREAGTSLPVCIETGAVTDVIQHAARSLGADVVLTGRGALPHFAGRLRSHAYSIVRDMPCPVLSF
ncbi:MAG TPA: universal stress protein [Bryobacteraceae bacterium]|jgi:nucleotide-binding universal stress UspA family protein|nr:universal stress protein [Bryobacteraceae bacterium]